jgi:hypothetical protein
MYSILDQIHSASTNCCQAVGKSPLLWRHGLLMASLAAAASIMGCQSAFPPNNKPVALMDEQRPLTIDQATQQRGYDKSTLYYPNGAVVAGHPRITFTTPDNAEGIERNLVDPILFVTNMVLLPFTYLVQPPGSSYDWHGAITEPTYTAQPAYPTENSTPAPREAGSADTSTPAPVIAPAPTADRPVVDTGDVDATSRP